MLLTGEGFISHLNTRMSLPSDFQSNLVWNAFVAQWHPHPPPCKRSWSQALVEEQKLLWYIGFQISASLLKRKF